MHEYTIGIDIGGTKIAVGAFGPDYTLLSRQIWPFDSSAAAENVFLCLCDGISTVLSSIPSGGKIGRIGVGVPGIVEATGRRLLYAPNTPALNGFPLADQLEQRFGAETLLENDANAAALAEHSLGAGRGFSDMVYSTISTGIGAGIILGGRLIRGSNNAAGEIGHMMLVPGGELCNCGNLGCAEAYAGGASFPRQIQARIDAGEPTLMREFFKQRGKIDGQVLGDAYHAGDPLATEFLDRITNILGTLYYNIYRILDVQCFVLGGGLTNLGETLFTPIRRTVENLCRNSKDAIFPLCIRQARFSSQEIGLYGAALIFDYRQS